MRAAVLAVVACLAAAPTALAADPPPRLDELWKTYPLDLPVPTPTEPERRPAPTEPRRNPARTEPVPASAEESRRTMLLVNGGIAVALFLVAAATLLRLRARRREVSPGLEHGTPEELIERAYALAKEANECDKVGNAQQTEGSTAVSEPADHDSPLPPPAQSRASSSGYADFGERVAGVLSAAEAAAEEIQADARRIAEELLDAARAEAQQVRDDAGTYDKDTRSAVEAYATERRRDAEFEVRKQLAEAESQARATREAAEEMARQIEAAGRQRAQQLREGSQAVEERLRKALLGLKRMTAQLEELLGAEETEGESLTDALKPYGRSDERERLAAVPSDDER